MDTDFLQRQTFDAFSNAAHHALSPRLRASQTEMQAPAGRRAGRIPGVPELFPLVVLMLALLTLATAFAVSHLPVLWIAALFTVPVYLFWEAASLSRWKRRAIERMSH